MNSKHLNFNKICYENDEKALGYIIWSEILSNTLYLLQYCRAQDVCQKEIKEEFAFYVTKFTKYSSRNVGSGHHRKPMENYSSTHSNKWKMLKFIIFENAQNLNRKFPENLITIKNSHFQNSALKWLIVNQSESLIRSNK